MMPSLITMPSLSRSQFSEIGLASASPFLLRPPLQNARSLPDRYPDPRPVLDGGGEDFLRLAKIVAGIEQAINFHAVPRPLLDLVEIAMVGDQRVVGLFVGPVVHSITLQSDRMVSQGLV